nr:MAG TPA: hypothetical protein [Bacteriophage sp.]
MFVSLSKNLIVIYWQYTYNIRVRYKRFCIIYA